MKITLIRDRAVATLKSCRTVPKPHHLSACHNTHDTSSTNFLSAAHCACYAGAHTAPSTGLLKELLVVTYEPVAINVICWIHRWTAGRALILNRGRTVENVVYADRYERLPWTMPPNTQVIERNRAYTIFREGTVKRIDMIGLITFNRLAPEATLRETGKVANPPRRAKIPPRPVQRRVAPYAPKVTCSGGFTHLVVDWRSSGFLRLPFVSIRRGR